MLPAVCVVFRRHDALWRGQALRTLPALMAASDMLICGEDLGFVPACLPPVMQVRGPTTGLGGQGAVCQGALGVFMGCSLATATAVHGVTHGL